MTVLNEELQGYQFYKSLTFEEFLLFIVNCSVSIKMKVAKLDSGLDVMSSSSDDCSNKELQQSLLTIE